MKKRILFPCLALLLSFSMGCSAGGNGTPAPTAPSPSPSGTAAPSAPAGTVSDYFPIRANVRYVYEGTGNEYASYDVFPDYTDETRVQQRVSNGGTETVQVLEVANGAVTRVLRRGEVYYRENFLDRTDDGDLEILLKEPIQAGTSWTLADGGTRTITDVSVPVDTPSRSYSAVCVETQDSGGRTTDYYAKGVGLVKTVTIGDGYEVSSTLSEIREDDSLTQTVRFYYPNVNDDKIYFRDRTLTFRTNDITRKVLESAYRDVPAGGVGKVFSQGTAVNSYYLNRDGMAYLDLSREFVTEMNAGSGYEAMILQCVANTFGSYCGTDRVLLTIDGGLYESGHIALSKGEYLNVQTDGCVPLS